MPPIRSVQLKQAIQATRVLLVLLCAATVTVSAASFILMTPMHTSKLSGQQWVEELLTGHNGCFYDQMGMKKHVFKHLLKVLHEKTGIGDIKHIKLEEQVAIFLYT